MSLSASEIEKAKSRTKPETPKHYTEEYRLEAVEYYRKAHEADPKKSIRECAAELGINDKTLNDWIIKHSKTKRVTQERTDDHKQLDAVNRRIHELESENKFLKSGSLLRRKPLLKDRF
jgi:transposase